MKITLPKLPQQLAPYKGILTFAVILFAANFAWKFSMTGDETGAEVHFFNWVASAPFSWVARHMAVVSTAILHFLGWNVSLSPTNILQHENNGFSVQVIWGCSGVKQAYICFCILAFSRGPWKKKLWYVPLGILVVYLFNIFRITFIVACTEHHPEWFHFLHITVFKYLFYGVIFIMWVIWEEKIAAKTLAPKNKPATIS